jgi:cytochrome P450
MRPPVTDWEIDFDHLDPHWSENLYALWSQLRQTCTVATSQRFEGGAYLPLRYQDIHDIAYDTEHFSSRLMVVRGQKLPVSGMPPVTSDPPAHTPARRLILPPFAPKEIAKLEPRIREIVVSLLDALEGRDVVDASSEFAREIPVLMTTDMLDVDPSDALLFRQWIQALGTDSVSSIEPAMKAGEEVEEYFGRYMRNRRANPGNDLISYLVQAELDGQPLTDLHIIGTLTLIMVAGTETTWSAIGSALWHLATHPDDRRRLTAEPELIPTAIEEFLRAYAPVTMAREVVKETTVGGCPYSRGGQVLLSFAAANRDPARFENPDQVIIDRKLNPHAAFGLGRHRCLGSNLARLEMTIAIEEWLKRFPDFELVPDKPVVRSEGQLHGVKELWVTLPTFVPRYPGLE